MGVIDPEHTVGSGAIIEPSEARYVNQYRQVGEQDTEPSESRFVKPTQDKTVSNLKEAYKRPPLADSEKAAKLPEGIALAPPSEPAMRTAGLVGAFKNLIPNTTAKLATWRQMQNSQGVGVLNPTGVGLAQSKTDWPSENRFLKDAQSQAVGTQQMETGSTAEGNKAIAKKFSRMDTLDYGFTFEYIHKDERENITLFINPEELSQQEPAKITVTQTKGGAFVDYWGSGLTTLTVKGVTGFRRRQVAGGPVQGLSGHEHFLKLRDLYRKWVQSSKDDPKNTEMRFYNWADQEYYVVVITNFTFLRNVARPLLYQYNITMTVIQNITEKVKQATASDDVGQYLISPETRAPLALDTLNKQTGFVNDVVNKNVDLTKYSQGTQDWSTFIAGGGQYWNSAQSIYQPVQTVVSEISQFSKDVEMYVTGLTSFISQPFNIVRDLANACGDVISSMASVTNIPHELIRSFNDMMCAIKALPESLYGGFTNPYQFEGVSNCGSTLGIPEAPVSTYDNSFTATAQVPAQRMVNQIVLTPAKEVILQETPVLVTGVYVSTDTERTGVNYFEKILDKKVTLTSAPNVPVVIDYVIPQEVTTDMIQLSAAGTWEISPDDTVERIALDSYNDASLWKQIVLFNHMEYPFIVDETFVKEVYATGSVRCYRKSTFSGNVTIPLGQSFYVPTYFGTNRIDFRSTVEVILQAGQQYVDVSVIAIKPGDIGNVAPRTITGLDGFTATIGSSLNILPTAGGKAWKVKKPGEVILIPKTENQALSTIVGAKPTQEELYGVDIYISSNGDFEESSEGSVDLKRVSGGKNLVQALRGRLNTTKGFYPYHPEYGSNLPYYIGQKNDPKRQDLVRVDVKETCLLDSRIEQLQSFLMVVDGDYVWISFDAIPIEDNTPLKVNLIV